MRFLDARRGIRHFAGSHAHSGLYMPNGVTMYHGDYAGDAATCDCAVIEGMNDHDDHHGHVEESDGHDHDNEESDSATVLVPSLLLLGLAAL